MADGQSYLQSGYDGALRALQPLQPVVGRLADAAGSLNTGAGGVFLRRAGNIASFGLRPPPTEEAEAEHPTAATLGTAAGFVGPLGLAGLKSLAQVFAAAPQLVPKVAPSVMKTAPEWLSAITPAVNAARGAAARGAADAASNVAAVQSVRQALASSFSRVPYTNALAEGLALGAGYHALSDPGAKPAPGAELAADPLSGAERADQSGNSAEAPSGGPLEWQLPNGTVVVARNRPTRGMTGNSIYSPNEELAGEAKVAPPLSAADKKALEDHWARMNAKADKYHSQEAADLRRDKLTSPKFDDFIKEFNVRIDAAKQAAAATRDWEAAHPNITAMRGLAAQAVLLKAQKDAAAAKTPEEQSRIFDRAFRQALSGGRSDPAALLEELQGK